MRKWRNLLMAVCMIGGLVRGMACSTDLRDAVITGAYDFVSGTTTDLLDDAFTGVLNAD